jgi:hypothetical protein
MGYSIHRDEANSSKLELLLTAAGELLCVARQ